ncbi:hypothetical protein SBF1_1020010 [Candidatus Desulfosporosinus infrequens]|uniref:Uncharacterized protein n=1 Tax=Candidatus Desulfosporosinus infrequens TaxID=2043169 RepID=A0A2U3JWQ5_9FIRM|nr:hypothetical protein SBF1_1020010 [Candidatus Desulfosporosinus infrequens]
MPWDCRYILHLRGLLIYILVNNRDRGLKREIAFFLDSDIINYLIFTNIVEK